MDLQENWGAGQKAARYRAGSPQSLISRAAFPCEKGCTSSELGTLEQPGAGERKPKPLL